MEFNKSILFILTIYQCYLHALTLLEIIDNINVTLIMLMTGVIQGSTFVRDPAVENSSNVMRDLFVVTPSSSKSNDIS